MAVGIRLELTWHGHACFEIRGSQAVVFDPHDGRSLGIPPPSVGADVLFVTHEHFDHNAIRTVKGDPEVVDREMEGAFDGMRVRTLLLPHDAAGGSRRGMVRAYRVDLDGTSFLHLGDVGAPPPGDLPDWTRETSFLFLPVGGVFTVGPEEAVQWVEALGPQVAVPMHYRVGGLSLSIRPVEDFLPLVRRRVLKVGHMVSFLPEDLEGSPQVWVFSL